MLLLWSERGWKIVYCVDGFVCMVMSSLQPLESATEKTIMLPPIIPYRMG